MCILTRFIRNRGIMKRAADVNIIIKLGVVCRNVLE
jgi:hypothetical protein